MGSLTQADAEKMMTKAIQMATERINKKKESTPSIRMEVLSLLADRKRREASELIVQHILKFNHIYTTRDDQKAEFWIYEEGIYKPQGKSYIKEISRDILEDNYTTAILNEIILKVESDTLIEQEEFFKEGDPYELPVKNGILDLRTKELKEFTPKKRFFTKLPVNYDLNAKCPNINQFFEDVLKDKEDLKVMMEFFGFSLIKDYFMEKAFMLVGDGRNGKGKSLIILKSLLGLENISSVPISQMRADSFSVSELHGKLVNIAGDISSENLKDTGMFKSLTGRDPVSLKRKFKNELKMINYASMVFACNELPRVYDNSKGFWSRWVLLEFPYEFITQKEFDFLPEKERINKKIKDPEIINKIITEGELSGLLNQAIDGLTRIKENKDFSYSIGTSELKDLWVRKSNSFLAFCMDHLEEDPEKSISKKMIRRHFSKYCKKHRIKGAGDKDIKATLQDLFGVIEEYQKEENTQKQEWKWMGIKWKNLN